MNEQAWKVEVFEDKTRPNEWRVEYFGDEGEVFGVIFSGPAAEARARYYGSNIQELMDEPS